MAPNGTPPMEVNFLAWGSRARKAVYAWGDPVCRPSGKHTGRAMRNARYSSPVATRTRTRWLFPGQRFLGIRHGHHQGHRIDRRLAEPVPLDRTVWLPRRSRRPGWPVSRRSRRPAVCRRTASRSRLRPRFTALPGPVHGQPAEDHHRHRDPAYSAGRDPAPAPAPHRRWPARNTPPPAPRRIPRRSATPRCPHSPGRAFRNQSSRSGTPESNADTSCAAVRCSGARISDAARS